MFLAADWCLRFRYFTNTTLTMDVIIWDIIADKNLSLVEIRNSTYKPNTNTAWYLVEQNIIKGNDFKVILLLNICINLQIKGINRDEVSGKGSPKWIKHILQLLVMFYLSCTFSFLISLCCETNLNKFIFMFSLNDSVTYCCAVIVTTL